MALGAGDADLALAFGKLGGHPTQLGHLKVAVVFRPFHIFLAVRLARSKSSLLVPDAREALGRRAAAQAGDELA